jgi:hypothetical protein
VSVLRIHVKEKSCIRTNVDLISRTLYVPGVYSVDRKTLARADEISSLWRSICTRRGSKRFGSQIELENKCKNKDPLEADGEFECVGLGTHTHKHTLSAPPAGDTTPCSPASPSMRCTACGSKNYYSPAQDETIECLHAARSRIKSPRPAPAPLRAQ